LNLLCLIDSLGPGGAQRQLTAIGIALKARGHKVRFLVYHSYDHFLPDLTLVGITCNHIPCGSLFDRTLALRKQLRDRWHDVVLAFLEGPSLYAELAGIPSRRWGLVVSERSANPNIRYGKKGWIRQFHRLADAVICNSHTNRLMLEAIFPFLRRKMATIYNVVDLKLFSSPPIVDRGDGDSGPLRIVVAASYQRLKNMIGVAKALTLLRDGKRAPKIVVDWYGGMTNDQTAYLEASQFVETNDLQGRLNLHPPTRTIQCEFARASAVALFSFFEGLPNVVCEGMGCGKPIILSDVCDAGNLVEEDRNGFLCDPGSPESIAAAIARLADADEEKLSHMGNESRRMAEELFGGPAVIDRYELILRAAAERQGVPNGCDWPAKVPESASKTLKNWLGNPAHTA
jgi:glycosyltransferase involved in cell wall biosynthesis